MAFQGFYTRQEQEDALAAALTNPNRVGSGFINLGPQQRFAQGPAANWQTNNLVNGGQVADWNAVPQRPQMPPQQAQVPMPPSITPFSAAPVPQAQPFSSFPANGHSASVSPQA